MLRHQLVLARAVRTSTVSLGALFSSLGRTYHAGKAAFVDKEIARELKKSNGMAFRMKIVYNPNDAREIYRKRHNIPPYAPKPIYRGRGRFDPPTIQNNDRIRKRLREEALGVREKALWKQPKAQGTHNEEGNRKEEHHSRLTDSKNITKQSRQDEVTVGEVEKNKGGQRREGNRWEGRGRISSERGIAPRAQKPQGQSRQYSVSVDRLYKIPGNGRWDGGEPTPTTKKNATRKLGKSMRRLGQNDELSEPVIPMFQIRRGTQVTINGEKVELERRPDRLRQWRHSRNDYWDYESQEPHPARNKEDASLQFNHFNKESDFGNKSKGGKEKILAETVQTEDSRRSRIEPQAKQDPEKKSISPKVMRKFDSGVPLSIPYTTPASEFLYGTSVVEAALSSTRSPCRKLYKLYMYAGENRGTAKQDAMIESLAIKNHVEIVYAGNDWLRLLDKMSGGRPHNGYVLEASPLPRLPVTALGPITTRNGQEGFQVSVNYQSKEDAAVNGSDDFIPIANNTSGRNPFVLYLDSILDPGNLGGIIRTAHFLGASAVAISTKNTARFSPVVLKASAGASENVTLFSVDKPAGFIVDSKKAGWRVFAAVAPSKRGDPAVPLSLSSNDIGNPLAEAPCILMLGSEGEGLRWNLRSKADVDVYIPWAGNSDSIDSLNVSVAAGVLCNAFLAQQAKMSSPSVPAYSSQKPSAPQKPRETMTERMTGNTLEGRLF